MSILRHFMGVLIRRQKKHPGRLGPNGRPPGEAHPFLMGG